MNFVGPMLWTRQDVGILELLCVQIGAVCSFSHTAAPAAPQFLHFPFRGACGAAILSAAAPAAPQFFSVQAPAAPQKKPLEILSWVPEAHAIFLGGFNSRKEVGRSEKTFPPKKR